SGPLDVAMADFNRDGWPDLVTPDWNAGALVFLGNGKGGFAAPVPWPAGPTADRAVTLDVNADGKADIVVASPNNDTLSVLLGAGDGTFSAPLVALAGSGPRGIAAADFDRDGRLDLVTAN